MEIPIKPIDQLLEKVLCMNILSSDMFKVAEEYINRSPQPLELKAYLPFSSLDDALVEMKAVSTSNVTQKLKQFLLDHAQKPAKHKLHQIATSDPIMGHQIVIGTGLGARHSVLIRNVMRALRDKTDQFLCLQPGQLERAQMDLARLYINQRRTGMHTDSPLVISSSPSVQEQVGVVPHRFEGLFSVKGEEGILCTKNLVPGEALFGERLIRVQNEDRTEEYRVWDPHRSKLGAAIHHGVTNIWIKPGSRVLYLGNVCGLTVSDLSDLVGSEGLVYVVGFSETVVEMAGKRPNVLTINAKWCFSHHQYRMLVGMVDVLFAEIDYHRVQPGLPLCRLWIHFSAAYIFTGFVCYLLYSEFKYISSKRITCFYSLKPKNHQFTVLVRGIPVSSGISFSESVENFFTLYYPSTYLSHVIVRRTSKLRKLIIDADDLSKRLLHMKSTKNTDRKVHYEKKLESLVENVRTEQSLITRQEVPAAFVSFKSRFGAAIALHIKQGINPTEWNTEAAPEPQDVYWPFFSASFTKIWISNYVAIVACIVFTVLFFGPVVLVQSLTHLDQLETWFPFLKGILRVTFVSQVITGYLPSLILQLFQSYVPPTMILLSSIQGYIGHTQIEKSACYKILWFTIWTVFIANVLSGSILYRATVFLELKNIPSVLAVAVPGQAEFFIAYVVTTGWTSTSSELFQMMKLIWNLIRRNILGREDDQLAVPSAKYYSKIPKILFFGLLGITYLFLAPLILPFLLVYFCLGYIVFRNQLLTVYSPKHETNGNFWPIVHNSTICSLVLMHIIAVGIFGLKKIPLASGLMIPLPVMTLLFNNYCQRRFIPLFKSYPAECLIKKDRDDQSSGTMDAFYEKLVTAYRDPALAPIQTPGNSDGRTSPLLQATEV